jgi:hypothetical protein
MRPVLAIAAAVLVSVPVFASGPGELLDCSDWVFVQPGYSCSYAPAVVCPSRVCDAVPTAVIDNERGILSFKQTDLSIWQCPSTRRTSLVRMDLLTGVETVIATLDDRCDNGCRYNFSGFGSGDYIHPWFDPTGGSIIAPVASSLQDNGSTNCPFPPQRVDRPMTITGFATTFEVLQTFTPQASLGFRVPYMPEGMPAADHFDTFTGPLVKPINFANAMPLACDYPTSPPSVGDYLSVSDSVPTPPIGQGIYYVTAATYQGATRYGRQTINGQLTGRDPASLPVCSVP